VIGNGVRRLLIVLVAVAVVAYTSAWVARHRSRDANRPQPASPRPLDPWAISEVISRADSRGERAKAILATRLLAGHLSAEEYRRDMASLAAWDAISHLPVTPPDQ
jgi:uncharacterized membrane protein